MNCPRCSVVLTQEIYEGVEIDRCPSCKGTWLDSGELTKIIDTREEAFDTALVQETLETASSGVPPGEEATVVKCPKCDSAMRANNYDYKSGIIIDTCRNGHGVWLDGKELEKIQIFREHCSNEIEKNKDEWLALVRSVTENNKKLRRK